MEHVLLTGENVLSTSLGKANERELWAVNCICCHMNFIPVWYDCKVSDCMKEHWYIGFGERGVLISCQSWPEVYVIDY